VNRWIFVCFLLGFTGLISIFTLYNTSIVNSSYKSLMPLSYILFLILIIIITYISSLLKLLTSYYTNIIIVIFDNNINKQNHHHGYDATIFIIRHAALQQHQPRHPYRNLQLLTSTQSTSSNGHNTVSRYGAQPKPSKPTVSYKLLHSSGKGLRRGTEEVMAWSRHSCHCRPIM